MFCQPPKNIRFITAEQERAIPNERALRQALNNARQREPGLLIKSPTKLAELYFARKLILGLAEAGDEIVFFGVIGPENFGLIMTWTDPSFFGQLLLQRANIWRQKNRSS